MQRMLIRIMMSIGGTITIRLSHGASDPMVRRCAVCMVLIAVSMSSSPLGIYCGYFVKNSGRGRTAFPDDVAMPPAKSRPGRWPAALEAGRDPHGWRWLRRDKPRPSEGRRGGCAYRQRAARWRFRESQSKSTWRHQNLKPPFEIRQVGLAE